jgi:2-haloacid dehalogenase
MTAGSSSATSSTGRPWTLIFDLGDVVLQWHPRAAYTGLLSEDEVDAFFADIDFPSWNGLQDAGRGWDEAEAQLVRDHPRYAHLSRAFRDNYHLVVDQEVPGTAAILRELSSAGVRLLALTNWSAELFKRAYDWFEILHVFEGIVVSGVERLVKPDPAIFEVLCRRYRLDAGECVYIDDTPGNVAAARRLGMSALLFTDAEHLRADLTALAVPI